MGIVRALKGTAISMTNGRAVCVIDANDKSGKVVRVASPYPNHQHMVGKSYVEVLSSLLSAGWKEIERRTWEHAHMQQMHKTKLSQDSKTST